ncbi:MAG: Hint domain-containing protein [Rhodobacteraceae bacterium]|nr:Hint domain-containing protein [Paracoccaceae bacterium]
MGWIALADHDQWDFSANGLNARHGASALVDTRPGMLLTRGSIVIETRLPTIKKPQPLFSYNRPGNWPLYLSLQAIPGGGLTLILDQGGEVMHQSINHSEAGRMDILRITYSWNSIERWGRLSLERSDQEKVILVSTNAPKPLLVSDIEALVQPSADRFMAPEVIYLAVSTDIEPVGPMPSLAPKTLVATPFGYQEVGKLRRGDLVQTAGGKSVPVLQTLTRTVPARGHFSPVLLRAPFFGLVQDIIVAPSQRLVISGSEVEYLFGRESVLVPAFHLLGGTSARPATRGLVTTYTQLLLPEHEALDTAGTVAESLYIGRLRRKKDQLGASLLADFDRSKLPDHGPSVFPVLKLFDALVLAEQRAA